MNILNDYLELFGEGIFTGYWFSTPKCNEVLFAHMKLIEEQDLLAFVFKRLFLIILGILLYTYVNFLLYYKLNVSIWIKMLH